MAAKTTYESGDRVKRGDRKATVLSWHKDRRRMTVLPDDRPRSRGTETWEFNEVTYLGVLTRTCPVCGQGHLVYYCPERA